MQNPSRSRGLTQFRDSPRPSRGRGLCHDVPCWGSSKPLLCLPLLKQSLWTDTRSANWMWRFVALQSEFAEVQTDLSNHNRTTATTPAPGASKDGSNELVKDQTWENTPAPGILISPIYFY
ncbi:hypothetical protein Y1Q_0009407 [Alligator mississippiensis]|uniref:Uncharacterized protein n=1 Tax=Alligator mississippiensis TaxID=8496 RepID=A0A151N7U4_ALLMI|nr:hypothetical protein Y1Q_0009407 [Alligator mississippiensis]